MFSTKNVIYLAGVVIVALIALRFLKTAFYWASNLFWLALFIFAGYYVYQLFNSKKSGSA
ncbi:MAG: hypothetical protein EAZ55_02320 [Cytophagales bacterium]|nr:MAG: hypothetical protein EAZ55_02320 [Cytophagales bacterium]